LCLAEGTVTKCRVNIYGHFILEKDRGRRRPSMCAPAGANCQTLQRRGGQDAPSGHHLCYWCCSKLEAWFIFELSTVIPRLTDILNTFWALLLDRNQQRSAKSLGFVPPVIKMRRCWATLPTRPFRLLWWETSVKYNLERHLKGKPKNSKCYLFSLYSCAICVYQTGETLDAMLHLHFPFQDFGRSAA